MNRFRFPAVVAALVLANAISQAQTPAVPAPERITSRFTFSWPVGPGAPAPRGGTTKGVPVEMDTQPGAQWQALQAAGISAQERDRRAILAMAGIYRVAFDFLEIQNFAGDGTRPRPYQSWGTERVFMDKDEPQHISLVHILEMSVLDEAGKASEPMVTKHWRQDWRYEPASVVEYQGENRWVSRKLSGAQRRGQWSQTVYQVDEAPRYGSLGRWEHNKSFSSWVSGDTARPLPRREWSVRRDYDLLFGTNRHTITPTGWLQEENNLKRSSSGALPYVGREYGVARYERLKNADFSASGSYYESTRVFWDQVLAVWDEMWRRDPVITLTANSDQSGAFADLFQLADDFAAGRLSAVDAPGKIRAALDRQRATKSKQGAAR